MSVPIRTLDQFELQDVGFVKIDVEGFEFSTLQGARATLERWRPNLLIEIDAPTQSAEDFSRTFDFFTSSATRPTISRPTCCTPVMPACSRRCLR